MNHRFSWLRRILSGIAPAIIFLWTTTGSVGAPAEPINWNAITPDVAAPNQLLIRTASGRARGDAQATRAHVMQTHALLGANVEHEYERIPWQVVSLPSSVSLAAAAAEYTRDPDVIAEPNYILRASATPNDPLYGSLWGMEYINAPVAWDITTGNSDVIVGVIDSGVRYTHEDLAANMWVNPAPTFGDIHGARWTSGTGNVTSGDPMDDQGHGTHVAGTVGAVGNNGKGVAGVSWKVRIMALKFLSSAGTGATADAISAVEYAIANGAHLTCNSWGGGGRSQALEEAIQAAAAANQLFVAAAGNDSLDNDRSPHYPSNYEVDNVISVAAVSQSGGLADFSNYGAATVHIGAPGVAIRSTTFDSDTSYGDKQGTSMACPHVAGAAALLLAAAPGSTYSMVRETLLESARPNPQLEGRVTTGGDLDLSAAIMRIAGAVSLDREFYRSDATVNVTVLDAGRDPEEDFDVEITWKTVKADGTVRYESGPVTLYRYDEPLVFQGDFTLETDVTAAHDDTLVVTYITADDKTVTATAGIDDVPPEVINYSFAEQSDDRLVVRWETDEPASFEIKLGATLPPADFAVENAAHALEHEAVFAGLESYTTYYSALMVEDRAGNRTYEPVDLTSVDPEDYLFASTRGITVLYGNDFEDSSLGWEARSLRTGGDLVWERGVPTYGPEHPTRCWGTVIDGPYPIFADAVLESPVFFVGDQPSIHYSHWFAMQPWSAEYDIGRVEVLVDGGWVNVSGFADDAAGANLVSGFSGGWRDVRIRLPHDTFANKPLRVRFHFKSGEYELVEGNFPGWYIDDFYVSQVQNSGVALAELSVSDDAPGGNGNGYAEPGETVELGVSLLNITGRALSDLSGRLVVRAEGDAALQPRLINGSPAILEFGDMPAEGFRDGLAAAPLMMEIPADMAPGTVLSVLLTLVDGNGDYHETRTSITISPRAAISGFVLERDGAPIAGATVTARLGFETATGTTAGDGGFEFGGLREGALYKITAEDLYGASLTRLVQAPATDLEFRVGAIGAGPFRSDGGENSVADENSALASYFVSGMVTYDIMADDSGFPNPPKYYLPIEGAIVRIEDIYGAVLAQGETDEDGFYDIYPAPEGVSWVYVTPPAGSPRLVPPPGAKLELYDDEYSLDFVLRQDGEAAPHNKAPLLAINRLEVDDTEHGDGDGTWDPGEKLSVKAYLDNEGAGTARSVTALLLAQDMGVPAVMSVTQGDADDPVFITANSDTDYPKLLTPEFEVEVLPGAERGALQRFSILATDSGSTPPREWYLDFVLQVDPRAEVSGLVTFADGENTPANYRDTRVRLTMGYEVQEIGVADDGTYVFHTERTDVAGTVALVTVPEGYATPAALNVGPLTHDVTDADFLVPLIPLDLSPAPDPADLAFTLHEGQSASGTLTLVNTGADPMTLEIGKRYHRTQSEMRDPGLMSSLGANALAAPRVNWSALSAADHSSDEVVVRFAEGVSRAEQRAILAERGLDPVFFFDAFPAALARKTTGPVGLSAMSALAGVMETDPRVTCVAPDSIARPLGAPVFPNDADFEMLYGLYNTRQTGGTDGADIRAPFAWSHGTGSRSIVVAVCDTGVQIDHPDLAANIWHNPHPGVADPNNDDPQIVDDTHGWNFFEWNNDIADLNGHGTHVAGTIGAVGNDGSGIAGVNWEVSLMVCRLTGDAGFFTSSARIAKAIEYAVDNGAHVSNHSWGGYDTAGLMAAAISYARDHNHLIVAAAGNDAENLDNLKTYPAYYSATFDNVITVAAVDHHEDLAEFSNFGPESVQIAAPGVDVYSTVPLNSYDHFSGTSMAAPHVAGAAALLFSIVPDATYSVIKTALINGARYNPNLDGWVKTGGALDLRRSVAVLGADWLEVAPETITLAPSASASINVTVNAPPQLVARAALYKADVLVKETDGAFTLPVPVSVKMLAGTWLDLETVRIVNQAKHADDLPPSPGDTIEVWVALRNLSSAALVADNGAAVVATLSGGAGAIVQPIISWEYLYGEDAEEGEVPFVVTLPANYAGDSITFDLIVTALGLPAGVFELEVPVLQGARVAGRVVTPEQAAVADALVEVWGAAGARTTTDIDGYFTLRGLPDGDYSLRVSPREHERSEPLPLNVAGADLELPAPIVVAAPAVDLGDSIISLRHPQGVQTNLTLSFANIAGGVSEGAFDYSVYVSPTRRVALVSDGDALAGLEEPLSAMGFEVERYTDNFQRRQLFYPTANVHMIEATVHYSDSPHFLTRYDAVILDVGKTNGAGRVIAEYEYEALATFIDRGGKLIVTGANPLSKPDNHYLAELLGVEVPSSFERDTNAVAGATSEVSWIDPFILIEKGDELPANEHFHDRAAAPVASGMVSDLISAGDSAKLLRRDFASGGVAYLLTGNADNPDLAERGVWQDIVRGILWRELVRDGIEEMAWLSLPADSGYLLAGDTGAFELEYDTSLLFEGTHKVTLLVVGNYPGAETRAINLEFEISALTLRAYTTGQVTDWRDIPIKGSGDPESALFQLIWAGPDGEPDAPGLDGAPTGDDVLLAVYGSGMPHGRFGVGHEETPDQGRFDQMFGHALLPDAEAVNMVYVRAWDGASFEASLVYGDSHLYALQSTEGEEHDFGSWSISNILRYARDSNGDGVPDGWLIENNSSADPRIFGEPLDSYGEYLGKVVVPGLQNTPSKPAKVAVSEKFIFALDRVHSRIVVFGRESLAPVSYYGGSGPANEQFGQPEGMDIDPRAGRSRLVVADTQKNRIQVLSFDPDTGEITYDFSFGSKGAAYGQFKRPEGVSIERSTGNIYVADTGNDRVQGFRHDGTALNIGGSPVVIVGTGAFEMKGPEGVAVDPALGIFVADNDGNGLNHRILHFAHDGTALNQFGAKGSDTGEFWTPTDVRIWRHTPINPAHPAVYRLCVADSKNSRIQVFSTDGDFLVEVGAHGYGNGELNQSEGCFPVAGTNLIYVADTGNSRIEWFGVSLDADGDGMDDFWEDAHGLDSSNLDDALEDPDGDGLTNLGEFLTGNDPRNPDTDGDGKGDLDDLYNDLVPEIDPPVYISLAAHTNQLDAGEVVVLTAVISPAPPPEAEVLLTLDGASPLSARVMQNLGSGTYVYSHRTESDQEGWTDGDLFSWYVLGNQFVQSDLFELVKEEEPEPEPMDPFPIVLISVDPPTLGWTAVVGGKYRIESTESIYPAPVVWTEVDTVTATADPMVWPIPATSEAAYFRVVRIE